MKTILSCCLVIILAVSCQMKQNQNSDESIDGNMSVDNTETCMVDTVKATAIFWIDKAEAKHCKDSGLRTIKAKVFIHENGKVDFLSFTKKQSSGVEKYILHHLDRRYRTPQRYQKKYSPSQRRDGLDGQPLLPP